MRARACLGAPLFGRGGWRARAPRPASYDVCGRSSLLRTLSLQRHRAAIRTRPLLTLTACLGSGCQMHRGLRRRGETFFAPTSSACGGAWAQEHAGTAAAGRRTASPAHHTDTRVVQTIVRATGRQCRGDPVGRPAGPWRAGSRDDEGARRHRIDPHPALGAGLSLPGRGVFSLPCNCGVQTVTPSHPATSTPLPRPG